MFHFITRKLVLKIMALTTVIGLMVIGFVVILKKMDFSFVSLDFLLIVTITLLLLWSASFIWLVTHPLQVVLKEIKALLTGREYKRILTHKVDEIGVIAHFFNEVTKALERASTDIKDQRRMSAELDIASKIQRDILPKIVPDIPGLTILTKNKSAAEIGGDSFDFITSKDNTFMYIGDATGHGLPAGLVMMMVNTLITTFCDMYDNAKTVIIQTNKYLKPLLTSIMYMTAVMLRWHQPTQKMYFCGAGHEYIIVRKYKTGKCITQKSGGLALGMLENNETFSTETALDFEPNDVIVLYTDGVTEYKNATGERYDLTGLVGAIEETSREASAEELLANISKSVSAFTENQIQEDDMSLIIIKYGKEELSPENKNSVSWQVGSQGGLIHY